MRSGNDLSPQKSAAPEEDIWAQIPAESSAGSQSQPTAPDSKAEQVSQPTPAAERPKRHRQRGSSHRRSTNSSSSRSSATKSSTSQPSEKGAANAAAKTSTDGGRRRRREKNKGHDVGNIPVRPQGAHQDEQPTPNVLGVATAGEECVDSNPPDGKPEQEAAPTATADASVVKAPSDRVIEAMSAAQGPPEGGETKIETRSMISALSLPVFLKGSQLVAMAATAVDVSGVVANIEATKPHGAGTASSPKDERDPQLTQDASRVPSVVQSDQSQVPDDECTVSHCAVIACALFLPCAILLLFVFVVLPLLEKEPVRKVCDTPGCVIHANAFLRTRNPTAVTNACEDFGLLVCSTWTNRHRGLAYSVVSEVVMDWTFNIENAVKLTGHESDILKRPMHLIYSCLNRQDSDEEAILSFINFLQNKSFAWPTEDDDDGGSLGYSRALHALIELAVRWALPLWFRIDLLPSRAARNRTLILRPSSIPIIWEHLHRGVLSNQDVYPRYLYLFQAKFFFHRMPSPTYQKFLHESAIIQSCVLGNLTHAIRVPIVVPTSTELQELPSLVTRLKADDWVDTLQSAFNASPPIKAQDMLLATNGEILAAVDRLFGAYDARLILYHTSWLLLQIIGVFTSNQLFNSASVHKLGTQFQKLFCAVQIEATDYLLLGALNQAKFASDERRSIKRYLEHVHSTAVEKVRTSSGIRSPVKEALLPLLERTKAITWPDDVFTSEKSHDNSYTQYVSAYNDSNLFTLWRSLREGLPRSIVSEHHAAVAKLPRLDVRKVTSYDPLLDVISVSFVALAPPLYYDSGTSAMLFGGLGYIYAMEIVQAINALTILLRDDGDINGPSNASTRFSLGRNMTCPDADPSDVEITFPSLPALEIAHAAYVTYRDEGNDLPLKGLEKYSPEQVFFLTSCLAACDVQPSGQLSTQFCNNAVKNFEPFARAFSCRPGSKMNSGQKCRFFEVP